MSDVSTRRTDDGGVQLVTVIDGANVVLAEHSAARVAQLVENAKNRGDVEGSGSGSGNGIGPRSTHADLDAYAAEHDVADYPADGTKADKLAAIEAADEGAEA